MEIRIIAETFPPGEFIKDELEARGWTQGDLARIMGRQDSVISAIMNGKRSISHEIAAELGAAFDTSAEVWMNAQSAFDVYSKQQSHDTVSRKARLFSLAPVKEMIKRGWIEDSKNLDVLEAAVLKFLGTNSIDEAPQLTYAAKRSTEKANPSQVAWVCRAKKIAKGANAARFSDKALDKALQTLRTLLVNAEDIQQVSTVLAEAGVRLVLVEGLNKGRIDGATFWLNDSSPVIALAIRYDRLDHFWFALMHELKHVKNRDGMDKPTLDVDLVGDNATPFDEKTENEKAADVFAEEFLVDKQEMENFIHRFRPLYSKQRIKYFAQRVRVNPAIVLGQLQHHKEVNWSHSREMLVKVREIVMSTTLTDGWGRRIPSNM